MDRSRIFEFADSETVKSIHYDTDRRELEIRFVNGSRYLYFRVPEAIFERFMSAESAGKFVHQEIKNKYEFKRLE